MESFRAENWQLIVLLVFLALSIAWGWWHSDRCRQEAERVALRYRLRVDEVLHWMGDSMPLAACMEWVRTHAECSADTVETISDLRRRIEQHQAAQVQALRNSLAPTYDPEPPKLAVIWYSSPEAVHRLMWEPSAIAAGMTYEQMLAESQPVGLSERGEEVGLSVEQELAAIRTQGCWAFVDTSTRTIHAWAADDADDALVLHMLAHEIGHSVGTPAADDLQEELRAEQFGRVARYALELSGSRHDGERRLTDEAQADRDAYEADKCGCYCHLGAAPCSDCTHPGNPHNQEDDEFYVTHS